ncbi:TIM barrel protein [Streptomyces wedmorensis]|uniref:TIM barrel protein n=1 Tax=Streptomyces wedmorensis TaxID=43759 RepID=UPI003448C8FC
MGIIGTGFIGRIHARAARQAGARLVGVAGADLANATEGAQALGAEKAFEPVTELITSGLIDVLHVCTPTISGPAYASVGRTWKLDADERRSVLAELRENLRPVLAYAGERGVRVGVEPLNRYETSLINTVEQALDALPDECSLALDTYHLNIEESSPAQAVRDAGSRIALIQVCGTDRGAPGSDHFDRTAFAAEVKDADYTGPLVIESFTPDNTTIATAASIWPPRAASQDDLATDGLASLRTL